MESVQHHEAGESGMEIALVVWYTVVKMSVDALQ